MSLVLKVKYVMKTNEIQIRDPFILKHDNFYYMYGSTDKDIWKSCGTGFDVYKGKDLENWEGPIHAFRPPVGYWGTKNFWAPEVHKYNGKFFMFATFIADGYNRGTAILNADKPEGPFSPWSDGAVTPSDWMCLDGTLYIDCENNPWIVFCHEWVQITDGTVCAAKLSDDLKRRTSEPIVLFKSSSAPWSGTAYSPSNNIKGHVTDGPFMHRLASGKLIMLWSCVGKEGYRLGYAISESNDIYGPWTQSGKPLFDDDGGHGMLFTTFKSESEQRERLFLAVHSPNKTPNERAKFVEVFETEDGLTCVRPALVDKHYELPSTV